MMRRACQAAVMRALSDRRAMPSLSCPQGVLISGSAGRLGDLAGVLGGLPRVLAGISTVSLVLVSTLATSSFRALPCFTFSLPGLTSALAFSLPARREDDLALLEATVAAGSPGVLGAEAAGADRVVAAGGAGVPTPAAQQSSTLADS